MSKIEEHQKSKKQNHDDSSRNHHDQIQKSKFSNLVNFQKPIEYNDESYSYDTFDDDDKSDIDCDDYDQSDEHSILSSSHSSDTSSNGSSFSSKATIESISSFKDIKDLKYNFEHEKEHLHIEFCKQLNPELGVKCLLCTDLCFEKSHFYFIVEVFQECLVKINGGIEMWKKVNYEENGYPLKQYLFFISRQLTFGQSNHIIVAFIYAVQLSQKYKGAIHQANIKRIMLACCLIASKHLDDIPYCNKYWADCTRVGTSFSVDTLNQMECELLIRFRFCMHPNKDLFDQIIYQLKTIRKSVWGYIDSKGKYPEDTLDYRRRVVNTFISLFENE